MSTKSDKYTAHLRAPNHAELSSSFWWSEVSYGIALLIVFILFVAAAFIIAEVFR